METNFKVVKALCNYRENPLAVDTTPAFSWRMESDKKGDIQAAYQIGVASSKENLLKGNYDIWDSNIIKSEDNVQVYMPEIELKPRIRYWWAVTAWNSLDIKAVSEPQFFLTGKLEEEWFGNWVTAQYIKDEASSYTAPYLRKKIQLAQKPVSAMLYICGLGYCDAYIEGERIGDHILSPAFTRYDKRVYYSTYDVLPMIKNSDFVLAAHLGNGWYNCFTADIWNTREAEWRHFPKLIAELHLGYSDGTNEVITTNSSWRAKESPIIFNGIRNGEFYDANKEVSNWNKCRLEDSGWENVKVIRPAGGRLLADEVQPIRIKDEITIKRKWKNKEGNWLFDLGQNFAGIVRLRAEGEAGQEITLKYAERLDENEEHIDNVAISCFIKSGEFQTDKYIKKSNETEVWEPRFVYHGFQYIEVTGLPDNVTDDVIVGLVVHTDFERVGEFACSDERINKIADLAYWSSISNAHGLVTDCPHREKNAWTGDSAMSSEQYLMNFDSVRLWTKWLEDLSDAQRPDGTLPCVVPSTGWGYNGINGPAWSNALPMVLWNCYVYTGDKALLKKYLPNLKRYFKSISNMSEDNKVSYGFGDWCAPFEGAALSVNMSKFKAPIALTDTMFFYNVANMLKEIHIILGLDESVYANKTSEIKKDFCRHFINEDNLEVSGACQTSDGSVLYNKLVEKNEEQQLLDSLVKRIEENNWHVDYGLIGSKFVMAALGEYHRADVIYNMVVQEGYPGYQYLLEMGATTLFECWNGLGSRNHQMFSDIAAVFTKYIAGISPDTENPGFRNVKLRPALFDKLDFVKASHESVHGEIKLEWEKTEARINMTVTVPFGTKAILSLPKNIASVLENTAQDKDFKDYVNTELGSGMHKFTFINK